MNDESTKDAPTETNQREFVIKLLSEMATELVKRSRQTGSATKADGYLECIRYINQIRDDYMQSKLKI
jgi:hypothetical protein